MLTQIQKEKKRLKKINKRKQYETHRNRNPKDNKFYRAYKEMRDESIQKMQKDSEKRMKEESRFGNKMKKFFGKFVPKITPRQNRKGK